MMSAPDDGERMEFRQVPPLEPSAFEIAAMAKLSTMLSPEIMDVIHSIRGQTAWIEGLPPEAQAILREIDEDRAKQIEMAIHDGTIKQRLRALGYDW